MPAFVVRPATSTDIPAIVRHRVGMFSDMGQLPDDLRPRLIDETTRYLATAMPAGEYVGWLATPVDRPDDIVAGAGLQRRRILPRPRETSEGTIVVSGREAIVLNVYTERPYRRRGLARLLMDQLMEWVRQSDIEVLVLHASAEGRPLYEAMGFVGTNEMRYSRALR